MNQQTSGEAGAQSMLVQPSGFKALTEPEPSSGYEALGLEFLLYGLQSPINIGIILRVAETYQFRVSILDQHSVLDDPQKLSTMKDFACGAMSRRSIRQLEEPSALARLRNGRRLVATSTEHHTSALTDYRFRPGDLLVLGNEYDGLPDEVVAEADVVLHVPMPAVVLPKEPSVSPIDPSRTTPVARDGQPNLNVAVTAGILCYTAYAEWLTEHKPESTSR